MPRSYLVLPCALGAGACVLDLPPVQEEESPLSTDPTTPSSTPGPDSTPSSSSPPDAGRGGAGPDTTPDASAGTGALGGSGGASSSGGSANGGEAGEGGSGGAPSACPPTERECGEECIALEDPCCVGGCDVFDHATGRCENDACVLDECIEGFVDCDGEPDNGCETDFNFEPVVGNTLPVPPIDITDADAWSGIPLRPIAAPCAQCTETDGRLPHPEPVNAGARDRSDVWAGFAIAWDATALYLRAQVFDDDMPDPGAMLDARAYDNIEFVFDGNPTMASGADDRLVFIGLDGEASELDYTNVSNVASFDGDPQAHCYIIDARFTLQFLDGGSATLELAPGPPVFQFDVAVNDYDGEAGPNADRPFEHTGHLFFRDPGRDYWYGMRTLPLLELTE